jgi:signal transduction histidine kinase
MRLELPPDIRSTISPIITALRWGALLYGMVAAGEATNNGDLGVVVTLSVALFLTIWRTFRPLRLAWQDLLDRLLPIIDGVVLGAAVGISGGIDSPFIYCLLVAVAIAAFGWGLLSGGLTVVAALAALGVVAVATGNPLNADDVGGIAFILVLIGAAALIALLRDNLIARQSQQVAMTGRLNMLTETNEMLGILNQVARTLPESMDMTEAVNATQRELAAQFRASTIGLVVRDEATSAWLPMISEGCHFFESTATKDLPLPMQTALLEMTTIVDTDTDTPFVGQGSASGLYTALRTRGKVIGVLAVECETPNFYDDREVRILDGLSSALALTIDNVRSFGRLRTIGADQERTRIARDLHDRLGQWLTYISMELERIMGEVPETVSLQSLYGDVQTAIDELRETLRQLRTKVSDDESLAIVGRSMVERFTQRTGISTHFHVENPGEALRVNVENELLRILQESLNNVEKHAKPGKVDISYAVKDGHGELVIIDDGKGFDTGGSIRDTSYGLMGMRERADVIGATLQIESERGVGTTVRVRASNELSV